ncbi:MAG TPA: glycosyltransferase, partial [Acetobacteraceae bacterium]
HVFPGFAVGGAQARFAAIANHYGRTWHHAIIAMDGDTACRELLAEGLDLSFPRVEIHKSDVPGNLRRFRTVLQRMQPLALITHNWGSIEWAVANALRPASGFRRLRHIHIEDGFGPEERNSQLPRRVLTRRLVLSRSRVVLPSRTLLAIATDVWRLDPKRLSYIPNGIDLARFDAAGEAAAPLPGNGPVIGTVAALRPEKNQARLIRAFALVASRHPARLAIAGDGPERSALEALARSLGIAEQVHFLGHQSQAQRCYRLFDIFALSSDTEQMPLTVLEAMAAGLPAAATDVGDIAAMLCPANRPFVTALDDSSLAEALLALLEQPALRHELGAANREKAVRDYDQQVMFRRYAALFNGQAEPQLRSA